MGDVNLTFAEALELALNLLTLFCRVGLFQGRLQFLQLLVEILLPPRQFTQPTERLTKLRLLLRILLLCLSLCFITILIILQLQFLQLLLEPRSRGAARGGRSLPQRGRSPAA